MQVVSWRLLQLAVLEMLLAKRTHLQSKVATNGLLLVLRFLKVQKSKGTNTVVDHDNNCFIIAGYILSIVKVKVRITLQ